MSEQPISEIIKPIVDQLRLASKLGCTITLPPEEAERRAQLYERLARMCDAYELQKWEDRQFRRAIALIALLLVIYAAIGYFSA